VIVLTVFVVVYSLEGTTAVIVLIVFVVVYLFAVLASVFDCLN